MNIQIISHNKTNKIALYAFRYISIFGGLGASKFPENHCHILPSLSLQAFSHSSIELVPGPLGTWSICFTAVEPLRITTCSNKQKNTENKATKGPEKLTKTSEMLAATSNCSNYLKSQWNIRCNTQNTWPLKWSFLLYMATTRKFLVTSIPNPRRKHQSPLRHFAATCSYGKSQHVF